MAVTMVTGCITGCGTKTESQTAADASAVSGESTESSQKFDTSKSITVCSREDGSGTRGAFIELFGIEKKDENGEKVDHTTDEANITNSTEVMMSTVAGSDYAIGYCSLGSLNDTVKALTIDGVEATAENVKAGTYTIARPFNIVTGNSLSDTAQDFINYIMSSDGQKIIEDNGYVSVDDSAQAYTGSAAGKVTVAGSSSVYPVMSKLAEAYQAVNTGAEIDVQESDSTTGIQNAIDGICEIGMASRALKDEETGVSATTIAMDGIAVIVNNNNPMTDISPETVCSIFTGEKTVWDEVIGK
jgi:phosphate transport system substrate-binding protein